ncbi:hypothetical protein HYH03_002857 [Edaphochlamys debaryana]|uniref:Uncharacterized protein n=1 Tax=Edaphochlamys debaryana TaxID=47281 RepID=A0A835YKC6_9CHLO|nr:hypothetical protein HYH03_002857 [Edaphochlamys debaryana]|eukprot:KAG2499279.1 hypothetical protein HYH03_002857 [Edaphochlamys debaryana]
MRASEQEKDRVSMEKFGCKFSELKDPQDRMSVGGTIGGNMRKAALSNKPEDQRGGEEGEAGQGGGEEEEEPEGGEEGEGGEAVEQAQDLEEEDGGEEGEA